MVFVSIKCASNSGETSDDKTMKGISVGLDVLIGISTLIKPYGPVFAMVAGPLKEAFFPGEEEPDFKEELNKLSTELKVKYSTVYNTYYSDKYITFVHIWGGLNQSNIS